MVMPRVMDKVMHKPDVADTKKNVGTKTMRTEGAKTVFIIVICRNKSVKRSRLRVIDYHRQCHKT
jgi:hypothetical protein